MRRDAELADRDFIEPKDLIDKPIMISRQSLAADVFLEEMKRVIEG